MTYLQNSKITIRDQRDVAKVFVDLLSLEDKIDQDKEHFYVMHLDSIGNFIFRPSEVPMTQG